MKIITVVITAIVAVTITTTMCEIYSTTTWCHQEKEGLVVKDHIPSLPSRYANIW